MQVDVEHTGGGEGSGSYGPYQVGERVALLPFGTLYSGTDGKRACSIVVVSPELKNFFADIQGTKSPAKYLVNSTEVVRSPNGLALVGEYVRGKSLSDFAQAVLHPRVSLSIAVSVARAVKVQSHGGIHPATVLITETGRVKLLGPKDVLLTAVQNDAVENPWVAPELQSTGKPTTTGDVYSIGMLLTHCLTGNPEGSPAQIHDPPIQAFVTKCLSQTPENRPGSMREVEQTLLALLTAVKKKATSSKFLVAPTPTRPPTIPPELQNAGVAEPVEPVPNPTNQTASPVHVSQEVLDKALKSNAVKWLVTRDGIDYGPFSFAEVFEQIKTDEITENDTLVDGDSRRTWTIREHPILAPFAEEARKRRDRDNRAQAELHEVKKSRQRGVTLYLVAACVLAGLAFGGYTLYKKLSASDDSGTKEFASVTDDQFKVKISPIRKGAPKKSQGSSKRSRATGTTSKSGGMVTDDPLAFDMSDDSVGDERLDEDVINGVVGKHGRALGACVRKAPSRNADIIFSIKGSTGRVYWSKVNGSQSGALYKCVNATLRKMQFPTFNGSRTRAQFSIGF